MIKTSVIEAIFDPAYDAFKRKTEARDGFFVALRLSLKLSVLY